jgi:magnesium and cobalt exporter, CNNM family
LNHIPVSISILFFWLLVAFVFCAFCAASETSMMSVNRYRLKHLSKTNRGAKRVLKLLSHPDRLLGVILIGSTFGTAVSASITNEIGGRYLGESAVLITPLILTIILLIFTEIMPKTLAALKPEATVRFISIPLQGMLWLLYPLVWAASTISNALLRLFGIKVTSKALDALNTEELRTVVNEASGLIPAHHQAMLLSILDIEKVRVDHIMIPRNEIIGLNLDDPIEILINKLKSTQHTLLPVYKSDVDNIQGILHTRNIISLLANTNGFNAESITHAMNEPYFIPEGTTLHTQLLNFQRNKRRMALVVDEYGDVLGLVTLEDILEEIVGEFTTSIKPDDEPIRKQEDGSFLVDGGISVRDLNRAQHWALPIEGPTTLSGLIIETLEAIPTAGTCILIAHHPIEVLEMNDNIVKTAKISPRLAAENPMHFEQH